MVILIGLLGASIAIEVLSTDPRCTQTSISAYYYTPVHAVFVASLLGIGACMVALKPKSSLEDSLLNIGGFLAPVVAFVPSRGVGECSSVPATLRPITQVIADSNISNNMSALLTAATIAAVLGILLARQSASSQGSNVPRDQVIRIALGLILLIAFAAWFFLDRPGFKTGAHYTAAIGLFCCIAGVVMLNAMESDETWTTVTYWGILAAMAVASAFMALLGAAGWDYAVLGIEASLVTLFACFWCIQTYELRNEGIRA